MFSIAQATTDLQTAFKRPEAIEELCNVAGSSANVQIRQYSYVLLRRRLSKLRNWQLVPRAMQDKIKVGMQAALLQEPEKPVRSAIAQFIGVLVRHEYPKKDPWVNDLVNFLFQNCAQGEASMSEVRNGEDFQAKKWCKLLINQ